MQSHCSHDPHFAMLTQTRNPARVQGLLEMIQISSSPSWRVKIHSEQKSWGEGRKGGRLKSRPSLSLFAPLLLHPLPTSNQPRRKKNNSRVKKSPSVINNDACLLAKECGRFQVQVTSPSQVSSLCLKSEKGRRRKRSFSNQKVVLSNARNNDVCSQVWIMVLEKKKKKIF